MYTAGLEGEQSSRVQPPNTIPHGAFKARVTFFSFFLTLRPFDVRCGQEGGRGEEEEAAAAAAVIRRAL